MGMPRRMEHYDTAAWQPLLIVAACGAALIAAGIFCQVAQLVVSIRDRALLAENAEDPWDGHTLEWSTASPPASTCRISSRQWARKSVTEMSIF